MMEQSLRALPDIALFVEVARSGSFRHAAIRLGLPPSTLSRRIAAMERRLGVSLLLRTTRSVSLAPAARPYYERCLEVLDAAVRAQSALAASQAGQACIRISMPVDLGVEVLGPIVAGFAAVRRDLRLELDLSSRAADLLRDPVDVAFRIGRTLDDRVVARKIGEIASGLYAAPALLKRLRPIREAAQLADLPCLELRTSLGAMAWRVDGCQWDGAPGPCALAANSVALLRTLAEQGHGVALLPVHVAASGVQAGRLAHVLAQASTPVWPLYAITAGRRIPALVRQLIIHVRDALTVLPLQTSQ